MSEDRDRERSKRYGELVDNDYPPQDGDTYDAVPEPGSVPDYYSRSSEGASEIQRPAPPRDFEGDPAPIAAPPPPPSYQGYPQRPYDGREPSNQAPPEYRHPDHAPPHHLPPEHHPPTNRPPAYDPPTREPSYRISERATSQRPNQGQEKKGLLGSVWKIKDEFAITVGMILSFLAFILLLATIGIALEGDPEGNDNDTADPDEEEESGGAWEVFLCCVLPFGIPGVLLLRKGFRWRARQSQMEVLGTYIRGRGTVSLEELSRAFEIPPEQVRELIEEAREKGLFQGHFDATGRNFEAPNHPPQGGPGW